MPWSGIVTSLHASLQSMHKIPDVSCMSGGGNMLADRLHGGLAMPACARAQHSTSDSTAHPCKSSPQDMERLEKQVAELGEARPALEAEVAAAVASGDYEAVQAASQRLAALTEDLRQKEDRWLDLADRDE